GGRQAAHNRLCRGNPQGLSSVRLRQGDQGMRAAHSRAAAKNGRAMPAMPGGAPPEAAFEERYALVCQAVAEGIYEWDIETNALSVSARLIEIFGFAGKSLGADDWNTIVHPEDFPIYRAALRDCFRGVTARLDCEYR